jgi:hypothetical protein
MGKTEVLGGKHLLTMFMSDKGKWRSAEQEAGLTAFSWYKLSEDGRHLRIPELLLQTRLMLDAEDLSKRRELVAGRHGVTSQKTGIFSSLSP